MAGTSTLASFSPAAQARFRQQRAFVKTYQKQTPGLVQRISTQCGCTVANVYSVLNGNTFNAEIIKTAYTLVAAHLGSGVIDEAEGQPEGLRKLAEARIAESGFRDAVASFQSAVEILKAQRRIYSLNLAHLESYLQFYGDDLPDKIAVEITEYLRNEAPDPQMQVTPLNKALLDAAQMTQANMDQAAQIALQQMVENGEIGPDGYPLPSSMHTLEAWTDPDPEAPGQHLDEHGEPTYFLSLRDSNRWKPEAETEETPESILAGLKGEMSGG